MINTATRIFIAAALVALIYYANHAVEASLKVPDVELPKINFNVMPMEFEQWSGEESDLDSRIFVATGAQTIVNRTYHNNKKHTVSSHVAVFDDPDEGIYHSPVNCYRASGWRLTEDTRESLPVGKDSSILVRYTTWEREGERVAVLYWFQLGEYTLFDRYEMGRVRWKMRNLETWPALVKVLLQTPVGGDNDLYKAKERLQSIAKFTYNWINEAK